MRCNGSNKSCTAFCLVFHFTNGKFKFILVWNNFKFIDIPGVPSQVQPYKVTCVKIQPFYSCIVKSRIYMCIRFYSCIVFTHAFWNVMNLSSGWQKLLNCLNYKKIRFQIILSNTMIIEFSRWWSSENIRKISQDLERFRKKIRRSETP